MKKKESITVLVVSTPGTAEVKLGDLTIVEKRRPVYLIAAAGLDDALARAGTLGEIDAAILCFPSDEEKGRSDLSRLRDHFPAVPVVVLSERDDVRTAVGAMKAGAQDYLLRGGGESSEILSSLIGVVERTRILSDWGSAVGRVFEQASRDPLTGLANRSLLKNYLTTALVEAKRQEEILAVLFVDLDHFKQVNDQMGHDLGDRVLEEAAKSLTASMRPGDLIARFGGDEFVAVLRGLHHPNDARRVAGRIIEGIEGQTSGLALPVPLTASIGISLFPYDGGEAENLIACADEALLRAKRGGDGEIEFSSEKSSWVAISDDAFETAPRKRVLIVDDDYDVRRLLRRRLTRAGYFVLEASAVEEAFKLLKEGSADLVLLDLGFHGASGLTLLENLTQLVQTGVPAPPVIVISGHRDPEIVKFAMTLGAQDFIAKPFDASEIIQKLERLLH
jgi:diguanylate cyclase (GGDEF)-like protein